MHVIIIQYSILESSVTMNFSFLPKYLPYFNYGAVVTVLISICVVFLGTILGVVLAFGQRSKFKPLVWRQLVRLDFPWDADDGSDYDCLCPYAYQCSDYSGWDFGC